MEGAYGKSWLRFKVCTAKLIASIFLAAFVLFWTSLIAIAPCASGEEGGSGNPARKQGRLGIRKASDDDRKRCEEQVGKLAEFFAGYGEDVQDVRAKEFLEGAIPNSAVTGGADWPDPLKSIRKIQSIFTGDKSVRGLAWSRYSLDGLFRLNQRLNAALEKGGFHVLLWETEDKGRVHLNCIAGELMDLESDEPLRIWGNPVKTESTILGRLLVRYPKDALEKTPSFTSDRKMVYHLAEIHRGRALGIWKRLEFLRDNGVDFNRDRIESEPALAMLKDLDGSITKLSFSAWRDLYNECSKDRSRKEASSAFRDSCVEFLLDDSDLMEQIRLQDTQGKSRKDPVDARVRWVLALIVHAKRPIACLAAEASLLSSQEGSSERKAAERLVTLLLEQSSKSEQGAGLDNSRALPAERLVEFCGMTPDDLRKSAEAAWKKISGGRK